MKTLLFFFSLLTTTLFYSQEVAFDWVNTYGTSFTGANNWARAVIVDSIGNSYTTGRFEGTIDFDLSSGVTNLTSNGDYDIFVVKADVDGNFLWAQSYGSTSIDLGTDLAFDASGNIILLGQFLDTVDFDYGPGTFNLFTPYGRVLLKLDTDGNLIWGKAVNYVVSKKIVTDNFGNIYVSGYYENTCDFDMGPGVFNLTAHEDEDVFVAKYDTQGDLIWAKSIGGDWTDDVVDIAVDASQNVFIGGTFKDDIDVDPGPGVLTYNVISGTIDGYVVKLSPTGDLLWSQQLAGPGNVNENIRTLALDSTGSLYVGGGLFFGTIDFDPGPAVYNLTGTASSFIQKLTNNGDFIWAKLVDGSAMIAVEDIHIKGNDLYHSGYFDGVADMDLGPGVYNLTSFAPLTNTNIDIYVSKLDLNGNFNWAHAFGYKGYESLFDLQVDNDDGIIMVGDFADSMDFDPGPNFVGYDPNGYSDSYVLRLNQCSSNSGTDVIEACASYIWIDSVTYTSSNSSATHTLMNVDGCDSIVTLNLTIIPLDLGISSTNGVFNSGSIGAGFTYQWLDCNNGLAPIPGETNSSYTPLQNGSYAVEVTNGNCMDTSVCWNINNVGINEIDNLSLIQMFPNPSKGVVTLDLGNFNEASIRIYTTNGKLVYHTEVIDHKTHSFELDVEAGIYLVDVMTKEGQAHLKLEMK